MMEACAAKMFWWKYYFWAKTVTTLGLLDPCVKTFRVTTHRKSEIEMWSIEKPLALVSDTFSLIFAVAQ